MARQNYDLLTLAAWSRLPKLRRFALRRFQAAATAFTPGESSLRVVFGGDVMFDPTVRRMWHLGLHRLNFSDETRTVANRVRGRLWNWSARRLLSQDCYSPEAFGGFDEFAIHEPEQADAIQLDSFSRNQRPAEADWTAASADLGFPFREIAPFFKTKDLIVLNLETPLSDHARDQGLFKSRPGYARAMRAAGVSLVNLSNNHIFDAGEQGFMDTMRHLKDASLPYFGAGENYDTARKGRLVEVKGTRLLFLSYTQFCNSRFASLANGCAGVLPLDRQLMVEDIRAGRQRADVVVVSVHWGFENQPNVHPSQVEIAHLLVDSGADAVIGHHPHVPHGIEIYRHRPIVYSLGNFIFAQRTHPAQADNFLAELVIEHGSISGLIVHPVAGRGARMFQPALLRGVAADALLQQLQLRSLPFKTRIAAKDDAGFISLN